MLASVRQLPVHSQRLAQVKKMIMARLKAELSFSTIRTSIGQNSIAWFVYAVSRFRG